MLRSNEPLNIQDGQAFLSFWAWEAEFQSVEASIVDCSIVARPLSGEYGRGGSTRADRR